VLDGFRRRKRWRTCYRSVFIFRRWSRCCTTLHLTFSNTSSASSARFCLTTPRLGGCLWPAEDWRRSRRSRLSQAVLSQSISTPSTAASQKRLSSKSSSFYCGKYLSVCLDFIYSFVLVCSVCFFRLSVACSHVTVCSSSVWSSCDHVHICSWLLQVKYICSACARWE